MTTSAPVIREGIRLPLRLTSRRVSRKRGKKKKAIGEKNNRRGPLWGKYGYHGASCENHTATENENKSQFITNVWRQYRRWLGLVGWARLGRVGLTLDIYEQRQQI